MNRVRQFLVFAGMLIGLTAAQTAFACSPLPIQFLHKTTTLDRKLPLTWPTIVIPPGAGGGPCPYVSWPSTFDSLSDADVVKYLGASETGSTGAAAGLEPAWDATKVYVAGNLASYGGKNYKARYWTQGDVPSATSAVWEEQPDMYGNPPAWNAAVGYPLGSKVSYNGNIYSAKWWTQNEIPGTANTGWVLVGPMVQPVLKRPAMFHVVVNYASSTQTSSTYTGTWNTDSFALADSPLADRWELRVNGIAVTQGTSIATAISACPVGSTTCVTKYTQSGSFTFSMGYLDQFSFWLCAKNVCRPTKRVTVARNAIDEPTFN